MAGWNVSVNFAVLSNGAGDYCLDAQAMAKARQLGIAETTDHRDVGQAILVDAFDHHWYAPDMDSSAALLPARRSSANPGGE